MFDCHGGWLRQDDAQLCQARGSDSGTLTGEKCWIVINKQSYLLKTVREGGYKQRIRLSVKINYQGTRVVLMVIINKI
jgi:hypothetical protein